MCPGLISPMVSSFPITSRPPWPKCLLSEIKNLPVFFFFRGMCILGGFGGREAEGGAEWDGRLAYTSLLSPTPHPQLLSSCNL